jgi:hypothetical protein
MKAARGKEKFSGRIDSMRGPGGKRKRTWGGLEVEEFKFQSATLPALELKLAGIRANVPSKGSALRGGRQ